MKAVSAELLALVKTGQFYIADLYTISLNGGGVLVYCSGDQGVSANGIYYPATGTFGSGTIGGPYFDRSDSKSKIHQKIGVEVDSLQLDIIPGAAMIFGEPFLQACQEGQFDGATFTLDRAFMSEYGDTSAGTVNVFTGVVAEVDCGRSLATFTVNSSLELLNEQWPHNLYQSGCVNNLGDTSCGVDLSLYMALGSAIAGSTKNLILTTPVDDDGSKYRLGKIKFTSGVLNGLSRTVQDCDLSAGTIRLYGPFPSPPSFGDSFELYFGCDKSYNSPNGCTKFANLQRFRGFPSIPQPVTAL